MELKEELEKMQIRYGKNRMRNIALKCPVWMTAFDPMFSVFQDKRHLLQYGNVCFAHIVQANTILFDRCPNVDCPAQIVYTADPCAAQNPDMLRKIAAQLYQYKHMPLEQVPVRWREIARVIADEYDRTGFTFPVEHQGKTVEMHMVPTMIFRKLLPKRMLCGGYLPILVSPDCKAVMVLPRRYWTKAFKQSWIRGEI